MRLLLERIFLKALTDNCIKIYMDHIQKSDLKAVFTACATYLATK